MSHNTDTPADMPQADRTAPLGALAAPVSPYPAHGFRRFARRLWRRGKNLASSHDAPLWMVHFLIWISYFLLQSLLAVSLSSFWGNFMLRVGTTTIGFVLTIGMGHVLHGFQGRSPGRIFLASLGLSTAASIVFTLIDFHLFLLLNPDSNWRPVFPKHYVEWFGINLYVFLAWTAMYLAISNHTRLKAQNEQMIRTRALAQEAQLKMLRYQINPHFLFNTLNALSTLVMDKRNRDAEQTINRLSRFLRYALDYAPSHTVTLAKELEVMNLYLEIERVRFADRLSIDFKVTPEAMGCLVPSLLLQPLIENAIKYAVAPQEKGGTITLDGRIEADRLQLVLEDDGPGIEDPIPPLMDRPGIGLANTRERLDQIYDGKASLTVENRRQGGLSIAISLPLQKESAQS